MADQKPYADLPNFVMAGNYGPTSKMSTAMAGFTPNTPWARIGCSHVVNHNGAGTSSSTPQIAAAAALYLQKYGADLNDPAKYPAAWMRVEAVRAALFGGASNTDATHFGRGTLRAQEALAVAPAPAGTLQMQPPDTISFELLRILSGLGIAAPTPRRQMLELEALQLSQSSAIETLLPDPARPPATEKERLAIAQALASDPRASNALRAALAPAVTGQIHAIGTPAAPFTPPAAPGATAMEKLHIDRAVNPRVPPPARRRLRVFAYDPGLEVKLETYAINQALVDVRWEKLAPGPVGEYVEVVDVDPSSRACYAPVDLDDPYLLMQDGRAPAESDAQFHQQMVYAVSMKTIAHFEHALGRVALWSPRATMVGNTYRAAYVQRLRIYPHALRDANAFYSPDKKALLFGYFPAQSENAGINAPGTLVFGALSYDIVAHETTHALLDGLHRRYSEQTNPDMLAFHEGFADIVALFQHFTVPEALRDQIARTRGDLTQENLLSQLAFQFGQASKGHGALRDALGHYEGATWVPNKPTGNEYANATEAHERGSVLVASVFDAFLRIYNMRCADLVRLATGGTGVLPPGNIPHDLVERLAQEASKVAAQWLDICIRALDYCPPVDLTFGDYLRALITADRDLVPDDKRSYRIAFLSAFRDRGIFAENVRYLSERSLAWEPPPQPLKHLKEILGEMKLNWDLDSKRQEAYENSERNGAILHRWLMDPAKVSDQELDMLGLYRGKQENFEIVQGIAGTLGGIEVHSVRPARRIAPDDQTRSQVVIEITQTWRCAGYKAYRGGVTLIVDLAEGAVRYIVRKRVDSANRFRAQQGLASGDGSTALTGAEATSLHDNYYDPREPGKEPFAMLHRSTASMVSS